MRAERRQSGARVWLAALAWGCLAAAAWNADRRALAQDPPEQQRDKIRDQASVGALSPAERREKIRSMSPAEKADLLQNEKRLAKLDPAKQERLRNLCRQLEADPNADALLQVMHRYYYWVTTHPDAQLDLAGLSSEKRVEKIKEMLKAEDSGQKNGKGPGFQPRPPGDNARGMMRRRLGPQAWLLRPDDIAGALKWQEKYVKRHGSDLLGKISSPFKEQLQKQLGQATDELHRYEVLGMIVLRWQLENPKEPAPVDDADLQELRSGLSESTRKNLELRGPADQWKFASSLITGFVLFQAAARQAAPLSPVVSEEELAEFFQNGLSKEQREWLIRQPGERIAQELWRMYVPWKLGQRPGGPAGFGPRGGKRGGPPGPRPGPGYKPFEPAPPGPQRGPEFGTS